jgi:hypothetical protein
MNTSILLIGIPLIIVITFSTTSISNHAVYAHTFSHNENTLFITMVHQIEAQIQLAENNFPANAKLSQQHANIAIGILNQNDPIVNDTTWSKQIAERNPMVAAEITSVLNSLKSATTRSKPASTTVSAANTSNNIKTQVSRITDLLGEALSIRISKEVLNNSTTQALVLARLANLIYFSYGRALGETPAMMSTMAGMAMPNKGGSTNINMNMKGDAGNGGMSSNTTSAVAMTTTGHNTSIIKNITEYQTAQSLATKAQEIFNKDLKPVAATSNKVTAASGNAEIEKDLSQLKTKIDNKAQFMDIMKLVHIKIHPTLITTYNLPLKASSLN